MSKIRFLILFLAFTSFGSIWADADVIGEILFIDGDVQIFRNTEELDRPDFGDRIENLDQVITGSNGSLEVAVYPETGIHASIIIQPDTSMYFDITGLREEQSGALELLTGRVDLTVGRLSGRNQLDIRTGSAAMGVRGTTFSVSSTPGGDVLLTTAEGRVECRTASGERFFAVPGEVVEKRSDGVWQNLSVDPEELETFRDRWISQRIEALDAQASRAIADYGQRYLDLRDRFIDAYVRLMNNREVIQKWMNEDRVGKLGSRSDRLREKRQIIGALMNIRGVQFMFERVYYRLAQLSERYPGVNGNVNVRPGLSIRNFYRQFEQDRDMFSRRMREVRYILKLYALRNEGRTPFDDFMSGGFESEEDFFGSDDDFF
ncbi:FecR family protein [Salinispira pacifica]|uniref:FecR protein domain-containing protein n=1 Tax=Salinispira pacifica TaxID=1307761 RepID=V5WCY6_9SPIO|nr:FecR family protein [Salinispira pacifica]AHC13652.1 hypothetical protein L21SP2_0210 [Salinispira pacifica]